MKNLTITTVTILFILLLPLTSCGGDDKNDPLTGQITFEMLSGSDNIVLEDVGEYTLKVRIKSQLPLSECWYAHSLSYIYDIDLPEKEVSEYLFEREFKLDEGENTLYVGAKDSSGLEKQIMVSITVNEVNGIPLSEPYIIEPINIKYHGFTLVSSNPDGRGLYEGNFRKLNEAEYNILKKGTRKELKAYHDSFDKVNLTVKKYEVYRPEGLADEVADYMISKGGTQYYLVKVVRSKRNTPIATFHIVY